MRGAGALVRDALLALVLPAVVVGAIYLAPFVRDPSAMPFGFDTASYMWRTDLVHETGVASLDPDTLGERKALGSRPAYPVVMSVLRSGTGRSALDLAWVTPALIAVIISLAAAALAADGLREPRWRVGTVAVAVAASSFVAWTAVGYATALAFDAIAVAVVLIALRVNAGGRGVAAGALLLGGGALHHWMFAAVISAVLAVFALASPLIRRLRRSPDDGPSPRGAPRLWLMLAAGLAVAALGFLISPELPGRLPKVTYGGPGALTFIRQRLPSMALAITLPLAAAGVLLLWARTGTTWLRAPDRPRRRDGALLLGLWAAFAVAGLISWYVLHRSIPPYRTVAFALAIPALVVLGIQVMGRVLFGRIGLAGAVVGAVAALAAVSVFAGVGANVWWHRDARMDPVGFAQLRTAESYLRSLPDGVPIVVMIDPNAGFPPLDIVRAGLGSDRITDVATVETTIHHDGSVEPVVPGTIPPGAVVLDLDAFRRSSGVPAGTPLGPGVTLVRGPALAAPVTPGLPPRAPSAWVLAGLCLALLLILGAAGSGWAAGLTDLGWFGVSALAPSFGLAVLGLIGTAASRLGMPLAGAGGIGLAVATAAAGWAVWAIGAYRGRADVVPVYDPAAAAHAPNAAQNGSIPG